MSNFKSKPPISTSSRPLCPGLLVAEVGRSRKGTAKALFEDLTAFKLYTTLNFSKDIPKMAVFFEAGNMFFKDTILIALQKKHLHATSSETTSRPSILMGQATQRWQEGPIFQALETLERQFREERGRASLVGGPGG